MAETIHASVILLGEAGLLIRGASGAGKSALAAALITRASAEGLFARLAADDRACLTLCAGRLVARPPAAIAGLIERRGHGILAGPHEPACVIRAVIDLSPHDPERLPERLETVILGVKLPCLVLKIDHWAVDRVIGFVRYTALL